MKNQWFRKTGISLLVFLLIFAVFPFGSAESAAKAEDPIRVYLGDQMISFDVPPLIQDGRTMVPFRALFEALGADVSWDSGSRTVSAWKDGTRVVLVIGKAEAVVNGESVSLDVAPQIVNGRTLVPLRFAAESLGQRVKWEASSRAIFLTPAPVFVIKGDSGISEELKADVKKMLQEEIVPYLEQRLPVRFEKKYTIKLYDSPDNYAANFGYEGYYYAENTYAVARLTTIMVANYHIKSRSFLREVLTHELVHVAIGHMGIRGKVPLWYEEGVAELIRHEIIPDEKEFIQQSKFDLISVIRAAEAEELYPLDFRLLEHDEGFIGYRSYDHYEWAIRQLEELYGYDKVIAYLSQLQKTEMDYEKAFTATFHMEPARFQRFIEEQLAKYAERDTIPFSITFTVQESFNGNLEWVESPFESEKVYRSETKNIKPGQYVMEVDSVKDSIKVIKDGKVIDSAKLHADQGNLFLSFTSSDIRVAEASKIERVVVKVSFGYGLVHYRGMQVQLEHGSDISILDEQGYDGFFAIDDIDMATEPIEKK